MDGSTLQMFEMVCTSFYIENKLEKLIFFKKSF